MKKAALLILLAFLVASAFAQTVSSSLEGTVADPAKAVVPAAPVTLTELNTGTVRNVVTDASGMFRFLNLTPGAYTVTVHVSGFKSLEQNNITLAAQETRDVGTLTLQLGNTTDRISVIAEATPVQTSSSEKSQMVDGHQLNDITLKGRDLFGYMRLIPGVIDTANRDVTSPNGFGNITINGNTSAKNFTVDGITDVDTGSNGTIHFEPNIDAIQELKVLTSNYQAEFGRNSGGQITVITKSGPRIFTARRRGTIGTKASMPISGRTIATG